MIRGCVGGQVNEVLKFPSHPSNFHVPEKFLFRLISSAEEQKGINTVQWGSVESQKGVSDVL